MADDDAEEVLAAWVAISLGSGLRRRSAWRCIADPSEMPALDMGESREAAEGETLALARRVLARLGPTDRVIPWSSPLYPGSLRTLEDPPPVLFVRGATVAVDAPAIAVVGARDATAYGVAVARQLGTALGELGVTVVSGLALGVDGAAHRGALVAGAQTLAVVGAGVDVDYPRQHGRLREEIVARGAIVSELPPGTPPLKQHFPQRNRLISGLAHGVIVVEASLRSGSLVTARHALAQGREIFAVPGSISSARSRGPHALLKAGAKLVESVDDVLAELPRVAAWVQARRLTVEGTPGRDDGPILAAVAAGAGTIDEIAAKTGQGVPELWNSLLTLELRGRLVRGPGGRFALSVAG